VAGGANGSPRGAGNRSHGAPTRTGPAALEDDPRPPAGCGQRVTSSRPQRGWGARPPSVGWSTLCRVDVYIETGAKRVFVGAIEWPGWCRAARSEDDALRALIEYGPRYAEAVSGSRPRVKVPGSVRDLDVVEQLDGNASTDFGAPSAVPAADLRDVGRADLTRLRALLGSCWTAFDRAVEAATGRKLAKGPRGGGRALRAIMTHVAEAEASYMARLGIRSAKTGSDGRATTARSAATLEVHTAMGEALTRAVEDGQPERGPRGGVIWTPRYLVRRTAWHAIDHAWEIEDRAGVGPAAR
jgi:hypothetical protein